MCSLALVACSEPANPAADEVVVRPSVAPVDTVGVETADLYRTREVEGLVERRAVQTVLAEAAGQFLARSRVRVGATVARGAELGVLTRCAPASTPGTAQGCTQVRTKVRAAVAGDVTQVAAGDVAVGEPVAGVRPVGFVIRAKVTDPEALYDLRRPPATAKARIVGGPAGFTVRFLARTYDSGSGAVELTLAVPAEVDVVEGLQAKAVFVISKRSGVATLPVTAVQGSAGVGQVVVVHGAERNVVQVELGQYDTGRVEVSGLPPGAKVLRYPLASDFAVAP